MKVDDLTKINKGDIFADSDMEQALNLVNKLSAEDIVAITAHITDLEQQVTQSLPEAAAIVWTEVYDQSTGQKYNLTSRSSIGELAWRNLKRMEQVAAQDGCASQRPNLSRTPNAPQTTLELRPPAETSAKPAQPSSTGLPTDPNDPFWVDGQYSQKKPAHPAGRNWGLVSRKPKASDLGFGDKYEIEVDEYEFDGAMLKFYKSGNQYPQVTHSLSNSVGKQIFDNIFPNWNIQNTNGARVMLANPMILEVTCTDESRKTSAGNPYQNLSGAKPSQNDLPF